MKKAHLYYAKPGFFPRWGLVFLTFLPKRLISTEPEAYFNMPFVVVVECLHFYGKQERLHRGQDEFLYRSL